MQSNKNKQQLAQSASTLGAALLGFGIGATWGQIFSGTILVVAIVVGAIAHVYGMYIVQMRNIDRNSALVAKILWITAWICLLILAVLFTFLILT